MDDLKDFFDHASNTNEILRTIGDLSLKMDQNQAEAQEEMKRQQKIDHQRYVINLTVSILSMLAAVIAAVAAILALR